MNIKSILALAFVTATSISNAGCPGCDRGYSDGERTGYIVKFSRKGFLIKSWEGSVNLGGTVSAGGENGGVIPSTWDFTVVDEKLVPKVEEALSSGKKAKFKYVQWMVRPTDMDSSYELVDITVIQQ